MSKPAISGITYILKSSIYVALTNRVNAVSLIESRGPSFSMPAASGFSPLPPNVEPTTEDVAAAVRTALSDERLSAAPVREVCFAGAGEPLLKRRVLEEAAKLMWQEHGDALKLRLNTNGLVADSEVEDVASSLRAAGFTGASVALASADPAQYAELMNPECARLAMLKNAARHAPRQRHSMCRTQPCARADDHAFFSTTLLACSGAFG